jgi:hypothetical protein
MKKPRSRLVLLVLSVTVALLAQPTSAPAVGTCTTPPTTVPVASLTPGTMAVGWTAVSGQTPVSFDVEILGVLPDGIAPGLDFVLIQVSGANVDPFGGIADGMSGSPVYIGSDLVGAVSYGFTGGDHSIGGLTPADDMVALLNYPDASVPTFAPVVSVPEGLRAAAADASRENASAAGRLRSRGEAAQQGADAYGKAGHQRRGLSRGISFGATHDCRADGYPACRRRTHSRGHLLWGRDDGRSRHPDTDLRQPLGRLRAPVRLGRPHQPGHE